MTTDLERAYDQCQGIAKRHARNFYYAFRTLPSRKRRAIYAAYAYCRACDDIADDPMRLGEKRRLFAETRTRLKASRDGQADDPVFLAVADASRVYSIPGRYFEEVIQGVEMDLVRQPLPDLGGAAGVLLQGRVGRRTHLHRDIRILGRQGPRLRRRPRTGHADN